MCDKNPYKNLKDDAVPPKLVRVWVVDDDEGFRGPCAQLLQCAEVECDRQFGSAEELLVALAQSTGPDAVLLDIHLPGMSGIDAIKRVKLLSPLTAVFMCSSMGSPQEEAEARAHGARKFFAKQAAFKEIATSIYAEVRAGTATP